MTDKPGLKQGSDDLAVIIPSPLGLTLQERNLDMTISHHHVQPETKIRAAIEWLLAHHKLTRLKKVNFTIWLGKRLENCRIPGNGAGFQIETSIGLRFSKTKIGYCHIQVVHQILTSKTIRHNEDLENTA